MLTLNPDGTVTVALVTREITLRRPSIIEYRTLRESVEKLAAVHDTTIEEARLENEQYRTDLLERPADYFTVEGATEEWAAREQRSRDNLRRVQDSADELRISWFREVVETLGAIEVGRLEDSEIPSLVVDAKWPIEIQTHWRTRPLVPGAR